jgi:transcriptional regulator with XRE-family HTH domain
VIRIDEATDWPTLLRQLYAASGHQSQVALAVAAGLHISRINQFLAGSNTPGRASLVRLLPALGYDLALIPREDA